MTRIFSLLIFLFSYFLNAQNNTIAAGEKLMFSASYNMSGLMTELAQVSMEVSEVSTSNSTLFRLKCKARTYSKWDYFFKIDDLYESYVHPRTLKPYLYKREINEGGYYKFMQYNYDHQNSVVKSLQRKRRKDGSFWDERTNLSIGTTTSDIVSLIYQLRNMDIHKAAMGSSDTFTVLMDNTEHEVTISLLEIETISTAIGAKSCYKLAITLNNNDVLKGKNANLLWLTADANKTPVYAKFKLAVGNGELRIKSATGLKH